MRKILGFSLLLVALSGLAPASDSVRLTNAEQHFDAVFDRSGVTIDRSGQRLTMSLEGWGAVSAVSHREDRVELQRGGLVEWYENSKNGLEQGFTVTEKSRPLQLRLRVTGDYAAGSGADGLLLRPVGGSGQPLRYGELTAWDADGKVLESRMEARDGEIRLYVNDAGARYPVTIDPIVNEPPPPVSNLVGGDHYGAAIAVSGDTALVGAPGDGSGDGLVYVYVRTNGAWVEQQRLKAKTGLRSTFGYSVGVSGDLAIVGAPGENGNLGAAYIYSRSGTHWTQKARLTDLSNLVPATFGGAVAIDGATAIIGAVRLNQTGRAYIFTPDANGQWAPQSTSPASSSPAFAAFVSIKGDKAIAAGVGLVYLGIRQGSTWTWKSWFPPGSGRIQSVSTDSQVAVVGVPDQNSIYIVDNTAAQQGAVLAKIVGPNPGSVGFGTSVAQLANLIVVGDPGAASGSAYATSWSGSAGPLVEFASSSTATLEYAAAIAVGGNHILVGAPFQNSGAGAMESYRLQNVAIQSNPPGQGFQVSGTGCGGDIPPGMLATPFSGYFTDCAVTWASTLVAPQAGMRYSFQNWADGVAQNPRTIKESQDPARAAVTYTGNMLTEYELTTQASPVSGGSVQGAGWFAAGTSARLVAVPNPGFQFKGFSGPRLKTPLNPVATVMNAPTLVTGIFTTTPPASLTAILRPPTGPPQARNWTISVLNEGPGVAYDTNLVMLGFRQTAGAPCVVLPLRLSPAMLPVSVGVMPVRSVANISTTLDFTGCPDDALFTVNVVLTANGGSSGGVVRLMNQGQ